MHFSRIRVSNFRSLEAAEVGLERFTCAVGHNNAGKSSLMIALSLFLTGEKLSATDYYDKTQDVEIDVDIADIKKADLERLTPEHRERLNSLVSSEGSLRLRRRFRPDGTNSLRCFVMQPKDTRLRSDKVSETLRGAKGREIVTRLKALIPELGGRLESVTTQASGIAAVEDYLRSLSPDAFDEAEASLPTGIPESITALLPEPIYIPAVHDVTDALKTKEAASFGRIVKVLLDMIAGTTKIQEITSSFESLRRLLNRTTLPDGTVEDLRLEEVKTIEMKLQGNLREQFADIRLELEVPPPELKAVFGGAKIILDDGLKAAAETKGDGVKRALTFSLIKSYVELRRAVREKTASADVGERGYIFLFEEPELYLHPRAQRVLYDALSTLSREHQVCVSTHSPYFLTAECHGTFIRVRKEASPVVGRPPRSRLIPLDLRNAIPTRDAFQLMCYENNSAAFFADRVVLVEGESDQIYLRHIARVLDPSWDFDGRNIALVRTGGKGSLERYWDFFDQFEVQVRVVADLDVLVDGFDKLRPTEAESSIRNRMLQEADRAIHAANGAAQIGKSAAKRLTASGSFVEQVKHVRAILARAAGGGKVTTDDVDSLDALGKKIDELSRLWALREAPTVQPILIELSNRLRERGVNVLLKGPIESYYPSAAVGDDKPSKAMSACATVKSAEDICGCCATINTASGPVPELRLVCSSLFS